KPARVRANRARCRVHDFGKSLIPVLGLVLAGLAACTPIGGPYRADYSETGTIVSSRHVQVRSDGRGGAIVEPAEDEAADAAHGSDTGGSTTDGEEGVLIGNFLGAEIEESSRVHEGIEYIIELDSGRTVTVVQHPSRSYKPGRRVRVFFGRYVRVVPHEPYGRQPFSPDDSLYEDEPYQPGPYDGRDDDDGPDDR
ncbi:MAG: hypothetical protein ACOC91_03360, partial [bacterium]